MFMRGEGEILRDLTTGEERARQAEDQLKHASTAAASQRTQCAELWKAAAALAQEVSGRDHIELQRLVEETDERRQLLKERARSNSKRTRWSQRRGITPGPNYRRDHHSHLFASKRVRSFRYRHHR
jgi:hypothetical protein